LKSSYKVTHNRTTSLVGSSRQSLFETGKMNGTTTLCTFILTARYENFFDKHYTFITNPKCTNFYMFPFGPFDTFGLFPSEIKWMDISSSGYTGIVG